MTRFYNFIPPEKDTDPVELRIDGDILMDDDLWAVMFGDEVVTPKGFLGDLQQYQGRDITLWINSYGGDVYAASRIYTALKEHEGTITVKIDGVAISAASIVAMAGDQVLMSPPSIMMIHNPWLEAYGDSADMRHAAEILDEVKDGLITAYQYKTGHAKNYIAKMMDEETWFSAKKAVSEKFADGILYDPAQADAEEPAATSVSNFSFSLAKVKNAMAIATQRYLAEYKKHHEPDMPTPDTRKCPVDVYEKQVKITERRVNLHDHH